MTEQDSEHCGDIRPHEPHGYGLFINTHWCIGVPEATEYRLYLHGIKRWSQVRDEIIPAIHRDFPGVLVIGDERVVYSTIPVYDLWRGASLEMLGLSWSLALSYSRALLSALVLFQEDGDTELTALTEEEISRVREHRG